MNTEHYDISEEIEPCEMPCCPLCDNEIIEFEPALIVTAHGSKGLAHTICVASAEETATEE